MTVGVASKGEGTIWTKTQNQEGIAVFIAASLGIYRSVMIEKAGKLNKASFENNLKAVIIIASY